MSIEGAVNVCYWSPTGWAFTEEGGDRCTCEPCTEAGEKVHPKVKYDWNRRIWRILKKQGVDYSGHEEL